MNPMFFLGLYGLVLAIIVQLIFRLIKYMKYHYKLYQIVEKIPGPPVTYPFCDNFSIVKNRLRNVPTKLASKEFLDVLSGLTKEYANLTDCEGIFRFWFSPFLPTIVVTDANIAQKILNSKYHLDKSRFYELFRFATFDGVFTSRTEKWQKQKREIQEHLKFKSLSAYIEKNKRHLSILNARIENCIKKNNGVFPDFKPVLSTFVLDTLGDNLFGTEFVSQQTNKEPNFVLAVHKLLEKSYFVFLKPWSYSFDNVFLTYLFNIFNIRSSLSAVLRFRSDVKKIIIDRFKYLKSVQDDLNTNEMPSKLSMLDTMIQTRIKGSRIQNFIHIHSQMNTFVIAGHDTTTSSLSWTLYLLGHHQQEQQKLRQEIDEFIYDLKLNNDTLTLLNMKRLKYLDSCMMESLRLYPSGPFIGRKSRASLELNKDIILPEGINYIIFIQHLHLNPKYFREPLKFYPDRFLKTECADELSNGPWFTSSAFMPFSSGLRMCMGKEYALMQQRMFLINLISRYNIKTLDQFGETKPTYNFLLSPAHFSLKFEKRTDKLIDDLEEYDRLLRPIPTSEPCH